MTRFRQTITGAAVATALLASLSLPSFAQTTAPAEQPTAAQKAPEHRKHHHGEKRGGDRMEHMQKRMAKLKADLKLTSAQESAWTTYTNAIKPAERPARGDREAFAKLSTPERIDKMREMRAKRNAQMDSRADATKAFYAQLNAEQQKTFDSASLRMHKRHGDHRGHHGGKPGQERPAPAPTAK
ncbi:Spy/CpxP family protein refolding chaperone [Comamonas sp. Y33R10-2]|uniref:Spy/CpxP family protein refolding chaperone n=1 Tax=Comamonas sp. Y33R10-2 TaxID=2853257 RepID=UPI001C5CB97B|nr:Spy/CpxP family protein refolding chaperone [Comamonas sp. Y33R10-2]QXZ08742.1 Spy/CpxP family protein refolding chaperone [Comamonas sp. Y33R10-2]